MQRWRRDRDQITSKIHRLGFDPKLLLHRQSGLARFACFCQPVLGRQPFLRSAAATRPPRAGLAKQALVAVGHHIASSQRGPGQQQWKIGAHLVLHLRFHG